MSCLSSGEQFDCDTKEDVGSAMGSWLHKCPYNAINSTRFATFILSAEQTKTEKQYS